MHSHSLSDVDRRFRAAFEAFAVTPAEFNHEAHVRLAYIYLAERDVEAAVQRMREALLAFLAHKGIPQSKFHETITRAWVLAVRHFMNKSSSSSAADFIARNPELLDSKIMLTHYSASVLFSADARAAFVEPDLDPIPQPVKAAEASLRLSVALPGSWLLQSRIDLTHSGEPHPDPLLGEDPVALLIYDRSGHFSAQFMKRDRSVAHQTPVAAACNNTQAQGGYDAYFGTYSVDDARGTVTQQLIASLAPGNVGMVLTRAMEVRGNALTIRLETTAADGVPVTRTLTWQRLGGAP